MDYLARREHSRQELYTKLSRKEYMSEVINETLDRLEQQDLLSDQRFAENFTRHRVNQGYGRLRIRQELRLRGVDDGLVELALQVWQVSGWSGLSCSNKNILVNYPRISRQGLNRPVTCKTVALILRWYAKY